MDLGVASRFQVTYRSSRLFRLSPSIDVTRTLSTRLPIHIHDFKPKASPFKVISNCWYTPQMRHDKTAQSIELTFLLIRDVTDMKDFLEFVDRDTPIQKPGAVFSLHSK